MSWQLHIDDVCDPRVFPDWQKFEKALIADVKAGKVPPSSTIILRKASKKPLQQPQEPIQAQPVPVTLIPPPSYTVPRMQHERMEQAKRDLKVILYGAAFALTSFATTLWMLFR